jgi:hypothetical protein
MTDAPPLSAGSRVVLRDLTRVDEKQVITQAIKVLVRAGAFSLEQEEWPRRLRTRVLLVAAGPAHDGDALLRWADRAIRAAPHELVAGRAVRDLAAVAEAIAEQDAKVRRHVVDDVLADPPPRAPGRRVRGRARRAVGGRRHA